MRHKIITVLGATGTGKTDLGIAIAKKFNGEVINADVMQIYKGLPIITNKATTEEQSIVKHHLLDVYENSPDKKPYTRQNFQMDALRLIGEIHGRGRVPVLVGGTFYYLQNIIFMQNEVKSENASGDRNGFTATLDSLTLPDGLVVDRWNCQEYTKVLFQRLLEIDPEMATITHRNDSRKILTYLMFIENTGGKYSEMLKNQRENQRGNQHENQPENKAENSTSEDENDPVLKSAFGGAPRYRKNDHLIFALECKDRAVYENRLRKRLDKMVDKGMLDEISSIYEKYGMEIDVEKGVFQAIGFREFKEYFNYKNQSNACPKKLKEILDKSLEAMYFKTRRYGVLQVKRYKQALVSCCNGSETDPGHVFSLDSTNAAEFQDQCVRPAVGIVAKFLKNVEINDFDDTGFCEYLNLTGTDIEIDSSGDRTKIFACDTCGVTCHGKKVFDLHMNSRKHKKRVSGIKRKQNLLNEGRLIILKGMKFDENVKTDENV